MSCLICGVEIGPGAAAEGDRSRAALCERCVRDVCQDMRREGLRERDGFDDGFDDGFAGAA